MSPSPKPAAPSPSPPTPAVATPSASGAAPGQSNAQLAGLLHDALEDLERANKEKDAANDRAQRAESLLALASSSSGSGSAVGPPTDAAAITALQSLNDSQQRAISDLSQRLRAVADAWAAFDRWAADLDARGTDARAAVRRAVTGLLDGSESDLASMASSPHPLREPPSFQLPPLSRKSSRTTPYPPHSLHIPPGAPGGRPISSASVPSNLPPVPIPSGVVAGRVRQRESSDTRRRSDDNPGTTDLGPAHDDRPHHRLSHDDADSVVDLHSESERHRKRLRLDAPGPSAPSSGAPARRDRAARFSDSPRSSNAQFSPQFTFPHNQPHYPPQPTTGTHPSPHAQASPYPYSSHPADQPQHHPGPTHPGQLQIGDRPYVPRPDSNMIRHPRNNSDSTLASAITPTSAATTMSARSSGSHPGGVSKDSMMSNVSYVQYHHRHSRSSGDMRMDSLGEASSIMIGGLRVVDSPRQMPQQLRRFSDRLPYAPEEADERDPRQRRPPPSAKDTDSMDVDASGPPGPQRRVSGDGETEDQNSVDELLLSAAIGPADDEDGEERDELRDDREMSPTSVHQSRQRRMSTAEMERERWKERDRQLERERSVRQGESVAADPPGGGQQLHFPDSNGLVKVKEDRFRHYYSVRPGSPPLHARSPLHAPQHGTTYPPPMTATFALNHGQLQQTGRRGTIAGLVTPREDYAYAPARASYSGQGHARRHSNDGPPSSGISHPSLIAPASGGAPLSAGSTSTSILFPHAQPRHTGPGPAVKPTLNAQGQRTCRQCHQPGRYKEGKCVEKWGPGPAGPGTVCDRCRKKMKRVERRGTQDAATLGQHIPLVPLAQQQQVSPRQYFSASHGQQPYARDGQQYSPSEPLPPQREYHFQTPLSATSSTWARAGKDWSDSGRQVRNGSVSNSTTNNATSPDGRQQKPTKEKRRAPSYSESPSPPPPPPARSGSGSGSGSSAEMESAAEVLMVELDHDDDDNVSPAGTTVKEKDVEDDADADGDMEDALGEEDDDEEDDEHPRVTKASRPATTTKSPTRDREKEQHNLKPEWVKLEEDGVLVASS